MTPQEFVSKWRQSELKERSGYQEHFIDLCHLLGHGTPAELDPTGLEFAFEAGVSKAGDGAQGWADVFKKGFFALEYKGKNKHASLEKAYQQLLLYKDSLQNPPLLIVSDFDVIVIHTNFTNSVKREYRLELDDLLRPEKLSILRAAFFEPTRLRSSETTAQVTQEAAAKFATLADLLRRKEVPPETAAHFLIRVLFCLFAEDVGLLPGRVLTELVENARLRPGLFASQLRQLFGAMAVGGPFGRDIILHFNGGLFDNDETVELDSEALNVLRELSKLEWAYIEPSIFGTLFERSLDPSKRAQLGAHYTSRDDILLIVEPVLMAPLRKRWAEVKERAEALANQRSRQKGGKARERWDKQLITLLRGFQEEIIKTSVLDPACGSGNFLYISLRLLLDLEKEAINFAGDLGLTRFLPEVSPLQLYGIEANPYAHELAQMTVWIGYIQWLQENGFGFPPEPILKPLQNISLRDAILAIDGNDRSIEPEWPPATVIVGNPPFLGGKRMRSELGDPYVDRLFGLYEGRVPHEADLVCYWFEKARSSMERGLVNRVGLLATNAIRGGANRQVLTRILQGGRIFWAQSDREWILDGATVRVSMVAFDNLSEATYMLDGVPVQVINADLTASVDLTRALRLRENLGVSFMADTKGGPFDLSAEDARIMLEAQDNPNGRPNSDVVRPWANGLDVVRRSRNMWIIDFGVNATLEDARGYSLPFEHVRRFVQPMRASNKRETYRDRWWIHAEPRPAMRRALKGLKRFVVTPQVAKHRVFSWLGSEVIPDHQLIVFARDDDYFMGVLQSRAHELWARGTGTQVRDAVSGFRYTATTTFETFPLPWPPGQESSDEPLVKAIVTASQNLIAWRDAWLNPVDATEALIKKRTLTSLYNEQPPELVALHAALDAAVFDGYGWPHDLSDDEILARLLTLNTERSIRGGSSERPVEPGPDEA